MVIVWHCFALKILSTHDLHHCLICWASSRSLTIYGVASSWKIVIECVEHISRISFGENKYPYCFYEIRIISQHWETLHHDFAALFLFRTETTKRPHFLVQRIGTIQKNNMQYNNYESRIRTFLSMDKFSLKSKFTKHSEQVYHLFLCNDIYAVRLLRRLYDDHRQIITVRLTILFLSTSMAIIHSRNYHQECLLF